MKQKIRCTECASIIEADVQVQKEPCRCGMSADYRMGRFVVSCILVLLITLMGSCIASNIIEYQKIKLIGADRFEIKNDEIKGIKMVPKECQK